jgi:hypothetical protein
VDAIAQLGGPDSEYSVLNWVFDSVVELDALLKRSSICVVYWLRTLYMPYMCSKLENQLNRICKCLGSDCCTLFEIPMSVLFKYLYELL